MKKEMDSHNRDELEDSYDESDEYSSSGLNEPKRSPMRRKEKFKTKDFQTGKKQKDRKRNQHNKLKYDFEF